MSDETRSAADGSALEPVANVSLLFAELPYRERFAAAAAAGFRNVETWWPWIEPTAATAEVTAFVDALAAAGVQLTGLNLYAGDMAGGERGVISWPDSGAAFADNLELVVDIADRTGCRMFNALYGQRRDDCGAARQDEIADERLADATLRLGAIGGSVLVEPLGRGLNGRYPLTTATEGADVVERVRSITGSTAIALLYGTFHLETSGDDLLRAVDEHIALIGHVQVADAPGRGEPGTGAVDVAAVLERLWERGYRGRVACEYKPTVDTVSSLAWARDIDRLDTAGWP